MTYSIFPFIKMDLIFYGNIIISILTVNSS